MQKVIRRTAMAERQAARRLARKNEASRRARAKNTREQYFVAQRDVSKDLKQARIARKEDWEMGALAPRRDVGDKRSTYGTVSPQRTRGRPLSKEEREEALKPFGGKFLNIVKGDRVVLLEGRDMGKIGKIISIKEKTAECKVEGLNLVDVAIPKWMLSIEDPDKRAVRTLEQPVPLSSVRLVFPLTDPETGFTRDVIVKKIVNSRIWHDRHGGTTRWSRIIPGLNIKIPWPKIEPREYKDSVSDTLRLDVETKTFVPTLLRPPMPSSVIDELRNKYSIFRTRHDPEYIEAKMAEDREKQAKKKLQDDMRTPLKEINRRERKLQKTKGKGKLTPEMLEKIGQVIARKRQLALDAAGMSKVGAAPEALVA